MPFNAEDAVSSLSSTAAAFADRSIAMMSALPKVGDAPHAKLVAGIASHLATMAAVTTATPSGLVERAVAPGWAWGIKLPEI